MSAHRIRVPNPDTTEAQSWQGHRAHTRARSTGTLVVLVDNREALLDDLDGDRWWLICTDHSGCVGFAHQSAAARFLHHPEDWCPTCQGEPDPAAA